ncbi:MAG: hypothetical protein RQ824_10330 [bacterium]|nr:hypothetical protein [bacterium]
MTILSAPRILSSGVLPVQFIISAFAGLTLVAAMATAWGRSAGMKGLFPPRFIVLRGLLLAFILLIILLPIKIFWFNPLLYSAVEQTGNGAALRLLFPDTFISGVALMLWVMSFEALFFRAAAMSFFARLTNRLSVALVLSAMLRVFVTWLKISEIGVEDGLFLILSHAAIINLLSCLMFARYGLPAPMLFAGGLAMYRWVFIWG